MLYKKLPIVKYANDCCKMNLQSLTYGCKIKSQFLQLTTQILEKGDSPLICLSLIFLVAALLLLLERLYVKLNIGLLDFKTQVTHIF